MRTSSAILIVGGMATLVAAGCKHTVAVEPIRVEPITLNINVRVDRELDEFFDFEDELEPVVAPEAAPEPALPQSQTAPAGDGPVSQNHPEGAS